MEAGKGRFKRQLPQNWKKNIQKKARDSPEVANVITPLTSCEHTADNVLSSSVMLLQEEKDCKLTTLVREYHIKEIIVVLNVCPSLVYVAFRNLIHQKEDAAKQNAEIMKFIITYSPNHLRTRVDNSGRQNHINVQYLIKRADGTLIQVCAKAFSGITGFCKYK